MTEQKIGVMVIWKNDKLMKQCSTKASLATKNEPQNALIEGTDPDK
jgi:hypothetical protein